MKLSVADLIVEIEPQGNLLLSRTAPYEYSGDKTPDIRFDEVSERFYKDRHLEHPELALDEAEYLYSGAYFYEKLAAFGGVMLHASCVRFNNKSYLFSARSGTGKSTHTHLWLKYLKNTCIVNDDKPAIRLCDGRFFAYGTPWSGKTDESVNEGVEIGAICFLERGDNHIERIKGINVLKMFMDQTVRPYDKALMSNMLSVLDSILVNVPVYLLSCDMSEEAVKTSFEALTGEDFNTFAK